MAGSRHRYQVRTITLRSDDLPREAYVIDRDNGDQRVFSLTEGQDGTFGEIETKAEEYAKMLNTGMP